MAKFKSKGQKKRFFSDPRNKNKVFKKKEPAVPEQTQAYQTQAVGALRKRGLFEVLSTDGIENIPQCSHGPCLLFGEKTNRVITKRYFACAVHRNDPETCPFKADLNDDGTVGYISGAPEPEPEKKLGKHIKGAEKKRVSKSGKPLWEYGCIPKKLKRIPKESMLVFCRECNDVFKERHACPSEVVTRAEMRRPSRFLQALDSQSGEAQFFFSDESLSVLMKAIETSKVDGVLCIGAPRVFEALKLKKKAEQPNVFMLDYDKRYAHFYPSMQYGQYSMLVDHFFDKKTEGKLNSFFAKSSNVLVVCDPPFGVFMEPLMKSIEKMKQRHTAARGDKPAQFFACIIIVMFVGKHVLRSDSSYWMNDYRVTYENHRMFSKPQRSIVRMFTNLPRTTFDLTGVPGYKYCEPCEQFVAEKNKHCYMCQVCTSKDGSPYHHCARCSRCVKDSYKHCKDCTRCHYPGRCTAVGGGGGKGKSYGTSNSMEEGDEEEPQYNYTPMIL